MTHPLFLSMYVLLVFGASRKLVRHIGDDAFAGCTSLQGIYFGEEGSPTGVRSAETRHADDAEEVALYNLAGQDQV